MNSAEHIKMVTGLSLTVPGGSLDASTTKIPIRKIDALQDDPVGHPLTYGQIVALGGDFYGDPFDPICRSANPDERFTENFNDLAVAGSEADRVLAIIRREWDAVEGSLAKGDAPSGVWPSLDFNGDYETATRGRYLNLAMSNFDHFGTDAVTAYRVGHLVAQQQAVVARMQATPEAQRDGLLQAYGINAFADHFLTDLFAAGHLRTPRRQIQDAIDAGTIPALTQPVAGLLAKLMHDEDNKFGLWLKNAKGDSWVAYGDTRYGDKWNAANRVIAKAAVAASMADIWISFEHLAVADELAPGPLAYVSTIVTDPAGAGAVLDPRDWVALFHWDPSLGRVTCRPSLGAVDDEGARIDLPAWALRNVWSVGDGHYMPRDQYRQFPPDETGPLGAYGWPRRPGGESGPMSASGPTLAATPGWSWALDGPGHFG